MNAPNPPFARSNPIFLFLAIAYLFSWACWLPIIDVVQADLWNSPTWAIVLLLIGGYGPSFAAIAVSLLRGGTNETVSLLKRFMIWRVGFKPYFVALAWGPLVLLGATTIYAASGGTIGYINYAAIALMPIIFLPAIIFGPLAEELGWRGFVLKELLARHGGIVSSILVGAAWCFWHAPLFWAAEGSGVSGGPVNASSVGLYLLWCIAISFVATWVFQRSKGSVILAVLVHLSANGTGVARGFITPEIAGDERRYVWQIGIGVLWAIILLYAAIKPRLAKTAEHKPSASR